MKWLRSMSTLGFELVEVYSDESDEPVATFTEVDYEEGCENLWDEKGRPFPGGEVCGGKVVSTGGHHHYTNGFDCYTMYLRCERCGDYEVECV